MKKEDFVVSIIIGSVIVPCGIIAILGPMWLRVLTKETCMNVMMISVLTPFVVLFFKLGFYKPGRIDTSSLQVDD